MHQIFHPLNASAAYSPNPRSIPRNKLYQLATSDVFALHAKEKRGPHIFTPYELRQFFDVKSSPPNEYEYHVRRYFYSQYAAFN